MKNLVVVGGGTVGWITALYAKKMYPEKSVVLVESDQIGILGAGEGAAPVMLRAINLLEISFIDLVKECKISIKNGIKFTNWSEGQDSYLHPFLSLHPGSNDYNFHLNPSIEGDISFSHIYASKFDHSMKDYSFVEKISNLNRVPFNYGTDVTKNELIEYSISDISIHFDARLLAKYLRKVGESRGIVRKEGTITEIISDEDGFVKLLKTENEDIPVDFVFDCTGFKRLIIGNFYKTKWISHKNHLPANSAISFFLPEEKKYLPPYTESIAMNYGWMWKIPLQHRYGCGYVFDKEMISLDDAKKELDEFVGFETNVEKHFNFNAGVYEKIWVKNCLAVGLSAGFIEPLEATSLSQSISSLHTFFTSYGSLEIKDEKVRKGFNERYLQETQEVVEFLYLHYVTNKKNTNFWKYFTKNNETPEFIDYILSVIKERPLERRIDFFGKTETFTLMSYNYILVGNKIITKEMLNKHLGLIKTNKEKDYLNIIKSQDYFIENLFDHKEFLEEIKKEN